MDVNFELYKIFYHAARSGNFSTAAAELFITQSAVSQAMKNLEKRLGVSLFFRKTRQPKLTPEGELLYTHIAQAYNFIKTAERKITEIQNLFSGEIRIGASDTVCKYFLLPYLESFTRQFPQVKLELINRTSTQLLEILKAGRIDLAMVTLPLEDPGIETTVHAVATDIWVASPRFTQLQKQTIPLDLLVTYPLILLDQNSATRKNLDRFLQEHHLKAQPEVELESVDLLVEFARIGRGIAHVLRESALPAINRGELFEVPVAEAFPPRYIGSAIMKNVPLSQAAKNFLHLIPQAMV